MHLSQTKCGCVLFGTVIISDATSEFFPAEYNISTKYKNNDVIDEIVQCTVYCMHAKWCVYAESPLEMSHISSRHAVPITNTHTHSRARTHAHTHTHTFTLTHTHTHTHTHTLSRTQTGTDTSYAHKHTSTHTNSNVCTQTLTHIHTHTYSFTYHTSHNIAWSSTSWQLIERSTL